MARQTKSVMIPVRFTPDDRAAIEKAAEKVEMNLSEYIRAATLMYMATGLNTHALQSALRGGMELLKEFEEEGRKNFFSKKVKV